MIVAVAMEQAPMAGAVAVTITGLLRKDARNFPSKPVRLLLRLLRVPFGRHCFRIGLGGLGAFVIRRDGLLFLA